MMSTPINLKYTLCVCFLEYNSKYQKPGSRLFCSGSWLLCSGALYSHFLHTAMYMMTGRIKGRIRHSFCSVYTYRYRSWVVAFKRPCGSSVKWLLERYLEKQKPNSSVRLHVYCTHSQKQDWYATSERSVHYTCTYKIQGSEHAGHQL